MDLLFTHRGFYFRYNFFKYSGTVEELNNPGNKTNFYFNKLTNEITYDNNIVPQDIKDYFEKELIKEVKASKEFVESRKNEIN